jgi:hypothetical protein
MFLENSILKFTRKPMITADSNGKEHVSWEEASEVYVPELIPWHEFRSMIFAAYDHRIKNAEELDGQINNTQISLDEHLVIFLFDQHNTRSATEKALIDFLSSLRFYQESWPRARTYAQMLQFLQVDESFAQEDGQVLPTRMNDGKLDELEDYYYDVYKQEYFLHCYSLVAEQRKTWLESKEGYTYVPIKVEDKIARCVLAFLPSTDMSVWSVNIRRYVVKIKYREEDEFDTDFLEVDSLLGMYTE